MSKTREVERRLMKLVDEGIVSRVNTRVPQARRHRTQNFNVGQAHRADGAWDRRDISSQQLIERLRASWPTSRRAHQPEHAPGLSRNYGQPLQFVLGGRTTPSLRSGAMPSSSAWKANLNLSRSTATTESQPQLRGDIDRAPSDLGVSSAEEIGHARWRPILAAVVTTFSVDGRSTT